jgi:predicted O-methyltransferase YrrM
MKTKYFAMTDALVIAELKKLHADSLKDYLKLLTRFPQVVSLLIKNRGFDENKSTSFLKHLYIPVNRDQGNLLYLLARAISAKTIVEFGTSFGISTIYLATALKDNGGGLVIGTEIEDTKQKVAIKNLTDAGLSQYAEIRLGDALSTLAGLEQDIDLLFLDGWKDLYLPVLQMLKPRLRPGALVLADNIYTFPKGLKPFLDYLRNPENGFKSFPIPIGEGLECAYFEPPPR